MPRQDVPYGGAICRLRERIAEIFDKLGEKLHTINGVPGDGDGNVKIVSGSSAVVITNDATQNEIAVSLDTSQLPAAAVSSVNGQTGAVALTADDVPSDNGDVQTDIDNLAAADVTLQGNINAEALARQGADSTLQTNINAVSASLPAAAAAAVAADPTVAYISSELSNKVDVSDVSTVETPDTIAKRNGSGRLVAADPASGATDKTLTTANWISQTGAGRPNNLIHDQGNETVNGLKPFTTRFSGKDSRDFSIDNYVNPMARVLLELLDANNTILMEESITKEASTAIRYDQRLRQSKDGTNANRIDSFLRTVINTNSETVSLQLFILVYENGTLVRSKSQNIITIQAV